MTRKTLRLEMLVDIRLWTTIAIIGICALSIAQGWRITQFSRVMMDISASENRTAVLSQWTSVPGLASEALHADLRERINPADLQAASHRREALSSSLAIKPLSPADWLWLSGMQLVTDQPMEQVLESLELSILTGPNEAHVMTERGIFGVSLWESLSPAIKSRTASDLAPMIFPRTPAEGAESVKLRAVIAAKSESVRNELRNALLATGLAPKDIEQRLGF